jgi:hypothetical protein
MRPPLRPRAEPAGATQHAAPQAPAPAARVGERRERGDPRAVGGGEGGGEPRGPGAPRLGTRRLVGGAHRVGLLGERAERGEQRLAQLLELGLRARARRRAPLGALGGQRGERRRAARRPRAESTALTARHSAPGAVRVAGRA